MCTKEVSKMEGKLWVNNAGVEIGKVEPTTPTIYFEGANGLEIIRLEQNEIFLYMAV
jgi:hypothetical protein